MKAALTPSVRLFHSAIMADQSPVPVFLAVGIIAVIVVLPWLFRKFYF